MIGLALGALVALVTLAWVLWPVFRPEPGKGDDRG